MKKDLSQTQNLVVFFTPSYKPDWEKQLLKVLATCFLSLKMTL